MRNIDSFEGSAGSYDSAANYAHCTVKVPRYSSKYQDVSENTKSIWKYKKCLKVPRNAPTVHTWKNLKVPNAI